MPNKLLWVDAGERVTTTIHMPSKHREQYRRRAKSLGMSLNQYVLVTLAKDNDLMDDAADHQEEQQQLQIGA